MGLSPPHPSRGWDPTGQPRLGCPGVLGGWAPPKTPHWGTQQPPKPRWGPHGTPLPRAIFCKLVPPGSTVVIYYPGRGRCPLPTSFFFSNKLLLYLLRPPEAPSTRPGTGGDTHWHRGAGGAATGAGDRDSQAGGHGGVWGVIPDPHPTSRRAQMETVNSVIAKDWVLLSCSPPNPSLVLGQLQLGERQGCRAGWAVLGAGGGVFGVLVGSGPRCIPPNHPTPMWGKGGIAISAD